ncbi:hypothetical protein AAIG87_36020, partial [Pseudomonas aeruginosa]|uniref:hypothetical protein n=1 Tax=Pseudomonas aeruginosa TaxID=287 RepID=UPI0031B6C920
VVFKTIGFFIANEVSPRFDHLVKEDTGFIGFKNMEQIAEGDKTVVYAVKTGKEAAGAIHHYLEGACSC